uniref:Uncharacterized protein n=1 Tax=Plectus sambesii TaxID=2011161 RepID=A0A914UQ11_9BILA
MGAGEPLAASEQTPPPMKSASSVYSSALNGQRHLRKHTRQPTTTGRRLGVPPPRTSSPANASRPTRRTTRRRYISAVRSTKRAAPRATQTFITSCWRTSASAPSARRPLPARDRCELIFLRRRKGIECPNAAQYRARLPSTVASGRQAKASSPISTAATAISTGITVWADGDTAQIRTTTAIVWEQRRAESSVYTISVRSRVGARRSARCARLVDGAGGGRTGPSCYLHRLTRAATMSRDGRPDLGQPTVDLSLILPAADRAYSETAPQTGDRPTRPPDHPPVECAADCSVDGRVSWRRAPHRP